MLGGFISDELDVLLNALLLGIASIWFVPLCSSRRMIDMVAHGDEQLLDMLHGYYCVDICEVIFRQCSQWVRHATFTGRRSKLT